MIGARLPVAGKRDSLAAHRARAIFSGSELEGRTGFHRAENADQPFGDGVLVELLFGPGIFFDLASMILQGSGRLLGQAFGRINEPSGEIGVEGGYFSSWPPAF